MYIARVKALEAENEALKAKLAGLEARVAGIEMAQALGQIPGAYPLPDQNFDPNPLGGMTCRRCGAHWPVVWMSIVPPCGCYGQYQVTYGVSVGGAG